MEFASLEICTIYTPFPTNISTVITIFCFDLFISAFISAFWTILHYSKVLEGHLEFPRYAKLLLSAKCKPKSLAHFSTFSAELAGPLCGSGWLSGALNGTLISDASLAFLSPQFQVVVSKLTQQLQKGRQAAGNKDNSKRQLSKASPPA